MGVKIAAAILVLIVAAWAWERHQRISNEHALAAVAGQLAWREVAVRCQGFFAESSTSTAAPATSSSRPAERPTTCS